MQYGWGFPGGPDGKESAFNAGDLCLIPDSERSPGEGNGYPLQYSYLENSMDKVAWGRKESDRTERLTHLDPCQGPRRHVCLEPIPSSSSCCSCTGP